MAPTQGTNTRTRKNRVIAPGPKQCHPRSRPGSACLPDDKLYEVGKKLGAPDGLTGQPLRQWLTRKTRCKTERCWVDRSGLNNLQPYFRPTMPNTWISDPDQWLDSNNINAVMKQYEEVYPGFKFYGSNPIDFASPDPYNMNAVAKNKCLIDSMCKMDLKQLKASGKTKLGFVYNLDPSNKGGSHWIASFTDIPAGRTYYFDSYGMRPPKQIARFMRFLTVHGLNMKLEYNAVRFQYGDTECGMYCLYFLIRMLEGDNFKEFCKRAPTDEDMLALRDWLFAKKTE